MHFMQIYLRYINIIHHPSLPSQVANQNTRNKLPNLPQNNAPIKLHQPSECSTVLSAEQIFMLRSDWPVEVGKSSQSIRPEETVRSEEYQNTAP